MNSRFQRPQSESKTQASLLRQAASGDEIAWVKLDRLYRPMLLEWARRLGASDRDADEAVSDVLIVLVTFLRKFEYDPQRSFRGYLRTMLRNEIRRMSRKRERSIEESWLSRVTVPIEEEDSLLNLLIAEEEKLEVPAILLIARRRCRRESTWLSWERTELYGEAAVDVAANLGVSVASVYVNRQRVTEMLQKIGKEIRNSEES